MSLLNRIRNRPGQGWRPDKPDKRDYLWAAVGDGDEYPDSVDLSMYEPPIWDQSGTNSCVAQAVVAAIMMNMAKEEIYTGTLSRLFAYWNSRRQHRMQWTDSGTSIRVCANMIQKVGICPEYLWKFDPTKVNRKPNWVAYGAASQNWDYDYYKIKSTGAERLRDVKAALTAGYPVVMGTLWPEGFIGSRYHIDRSPVWTDEKRKFVGGHAVLIVGYEPDGDVPNYDWFDIRNSHGKDWGNKGHILLGQDWIAWDQTRDLTVLIGGK